MRQKKLKKSLLINEMIVLFLDRVKWFGFRKAFWTIKRGVLWMKERLIDHHVLYPSHQESLLIRSLSRTLIQVYNGDFGHNINLTQYFIGFGLIHYAFVRNIKPTRILCVGSRKGYIPAILALACKDNGRGHVDFVDAGFDRDEKERHWSGIGFWKKINPDKHFSIIGVSSYISTHIMTTQEYAKKFSTQRYQYIYIDGDHSYEGVKKDYSLFWPKLDKMGFMSFHDVVARGYLDSGLFGIWKFWKELKNKHMFIFPFPKESGLGFIQKG